MPHARIRLVSIRRLGTAALVAAMLAVPVSAAAQSAATMYKRALAREEAARASRSTSIRTLRSIATDYERIVRRYPRSGYCDDALWRAAGVLQLAYEKESFIRDRVKGTSLLEWLRKEYPHSDYVKQVPERLAALQPPAKRAPAKTADAATAAAGDRAAPTGDANTAVDPETAETSRPADARTNTAADAPDETPASVSRQAAVQQALVERPVDSAPARRPAAPPAPVFVPQPFPVASNSAEQPARETSLATSAPVASAPATSTPATSAPPASAAVTSAAPASTPSAPASSASVPPVTAVAAASVAAEPLPALPVTATTAVAAATAASQPALHPAPAPAPAAKPVEAETAKTDATPPATAPVAEPEPATPPVAVRSIAYTKLPKGDRVTLELTQEAAFTTSRASNSDLLVLGFADTTAPAAVVRAASSIRGSFVDQLSLDAEPGAPLQVRVKLNGTPRYSTFPLYDPYRLVIDFEGDTGAAPEAASASAAAAPAAATVAAAVAPRATVADTAPRPTAPASTSRGDYSLARQLGLGVSRIVIDPGHGGHDPGATANGVTEADLVLDVALRLEKLLLAQPGFEVVLTRRTDEYVALEERTAIANREGADLFLSIHANASPNRDTRGIETYILNFASNANAEAVAARENASSAQAMHILPQLVKTIATNDKVEESRELARFVQTSLMKRIGSLSKTIKNLGVKQAPFVVLIGAEMPSVLSEVSFLTNKTEASLLKQAAHRQRIAQALSDAVIEYQASLKKVTSVAERTAER